MKLFRSELHVHTVLSPCAELEMQPPLIVAEALQKNIAIIAITDHNASANISAVMKAAQGSGLTILPGMEVQTVEEVHSLCIFDTIEQINAWQSIVSNALPPIRNNPEYFGEQLIVDENGDFIAREDQLLLTSTYLTLDEAWSIVTKMGGLFIPAHVDRRANGLLAILGLVPEDIPFSGLEISRNLSPVEASARFPQLKAYSLIQGGDAHQLEAIRGVNEFWIEQPTVSELTLALQNHLDRSLDILKIT